MTDNIIVFPGGTSREDFQDKYWAANYLSMSVSWVERAHRTHGLPSHKIGGRRKYRPSEIEAWVQAQRRDAA